MIDESRIQEAADVVVRPSRIEGLGVFAARPFLTGERIRRVNVVREITPDAPIREELGERIDHCSYPDGKVVLFGSPDRYLNHSCDPNAWEQYEGGASYLVARQKIAAGEEITCDYNINIADGTAWPCRCGAARCLGTTVGDYFRLPPDMQREYRPFLAEWFVRRHSDRLAALDPEPRLEPRVAPAEEGHDADSTMTLTEVLLAEAEADYAIADRLFRRVADGELGWNPPGGRDWMTVGQLLMHCASFGCGKAVQGFVTGEWPVDAQNAKVDTHVPPPAALPTVHSVQEALDLLEEDRRLTMRCLAAAGEPNLLVRRVTAPWGGRELSLFQQLLVMLKHLAQHKGQLFYYLKLMGKDVKTADLWGVEVR